MPPKQMGRFNDNTQEARKMKELFLSGALTGDEKPSDVKYKYDNYFGHIGTKAFGDKMRKFKDIYARTRQGNDML